MDFTEVLEKLNGAEVKSNNVMRAIQRINDLRPCLAYALAEIDAEEKKDAIPPTPENQDLINREDNPPLDVDPLELTATKESVEKEVVDPIEIKTEGTKEEVIEAHKTVGNGPGPQAVKEVKEGNDDSAKAGSGA